MRTNTQAVKASATKRKPAPVILEIDGDLAERIRKGAKTIGMRPDKLAQMLVSFGNLMIEPSEEGRTYRLECGLQAIRQSGRRIAILEEKGAA